MTHDDAREQAEILARIERRVERLERRETNELTPLILRLSQDTTAASDAVSGTQGDVDKWLWNSDDAGNWNEDVLGPANVNRSVVDQAAANDTATTRSPSTTTDTAATTDTTTSTVEDAPTWTWADGDGDGTAAWNETLYDG